MKKLTIIFAFLIVGMFAQINFAQSEKEMLIKTVRAIEVKPFDKETKKMREQALKWVIETDQVSVVACGGVMSPFLEKKNKFGSDLTVAYTLGMAAFKLENPDKKGDENAAQLAGLESALKSYEAMLKENPKGKFDAVDSLLARRSEGTLPKYVSDADCGKK
jgi:general stress protein CsbA